MTATTTDAAEVTILMVREQWLYVTEHQGVMSVYRSPELRDGDDWYREAMALVGDAELIAREVVEDDSMMFGEAEHSLYAVAA